MKKDLLRKRSALFLAIMLAVMTVLSGCGNPASDPAQTPSAEAESPESKEPSSEPADEPADEPAEVVTEPGGATPAVHRQDYDHSSVDISKPYTVLMYLVGDRNPGMDDVLKEINTILEGEYNTTLDIQFLSWADYQTMYPLLLAGGEKVDLIYTSSWCYLYSEAAKGSFYEMDMDFIETNMPMSYANQIPESWGTTTVNGSIVAIPNNMLIESYKFVGIRQDLAEKHGITSLNSWDDYMNYALTIAEKETPESGILAFHAASGSIEVWRTYYQQFNALPVYNDDFLTVYPEDGVLPEAEEIKMAVATDWFRSFAHDMKKLADAGAWSRSAASETINNYQAFSNLTGASTFWNRSIFNYMREAEKASGDVVAVPYDLTPGTRVFCEEYNNNCMAIAANSENPERAALVADLLSFDYELNLLSTLGIEGVNWTDVDGRYHSLPQGEENTYGATANSLGWWCKKGYKLAVVTDQQQEDFGAALIPRLTSNPCITFVFNEEPVKAYLAAVRAVKDEYFNTLTLGLVDDVDATIDQMLSQMEASGMQQVYDEFYRQYNEWKATR